MDVLNEKALYSDVVSPALDKIRAELVPALQQAVALALSGGIEQVSNVIRGVLLGVQASVDSIPRVAGESIGAPDLRSLLDGFTLTITPQGPIASLTGPIIITLGAPPKQEQQP